MINVRAIPAEENVSSSSSIVKENSTYENTSSEEIKSQLDEPSAGIAVRYIHYAEAKGTGISTMREEMKKANLSVPLIESDRASNLFVLTLLPHHLFDQQDIEWLKLLKLIT